MGTGYTRADVSNNIADGNIINASDIDSEYDAIEAAFNSSTGHTHDGTSAEGGPITVLGPVQDFVASATEIKPKTTNTLDIGTSGLQFKDLYLDGTAYLDDVQAVGAVDITGDLDVDNININGNTISSTDTNGNITLAPDGTGVVALSSTDLTFGDNDKAIFGAGSDLQIYHDASNSYIVDSGTGNLQIAGTTNVNIQKGDLSEYMAKFIADGAVELYYDSSKKLATTSSGIDVTGTMTADGIIMSDNEVVKLGNSSDLWIYHDGNNSKIVDTGTGDLLIQGDQIKIMNAAGTETKAYFVSNGQAYLHFDNSAKLSTTSGGIDVTGTAVTDGLTVAGNVSVDGGTIKLDGNYPVGTGNVALGDAALDDGSLSGNYNTAVGNVAMTANTSGEQSVGIGHNSLGSNTTGNYNVAAGFAALYTNNGSENTAIGHEAAYLNSSGAYNTAIGKSALRSNTTADNNTAVGYASLYANTTGTQNTAIGMYTLNANTTASYNTAVGMQSLYSNTTGEENTAVGQAALDANTTGKENVAVGASALSANTTADANTAVGRMALRDSTAARNTAVGHQTLVLTTGGANNTAVGAGAMTFNTTGAGNAVLGDQAFYSSTTGAYSAAIGRHALYSNTTGNYNTAVGSDALRANTTASYNTAVGYQAGYSNTTGQSNTAIGYQAGYSVTTNSGNTFLGNFAGNSTTGASNTFAGSGAGYLVTTGSKNTVVGLYNGNQGGLDIRTASNYIVLSDGDGNPRGIFDGSGNFLVGTTSNDASTTSSNAGVNVRAVGQIATATDGTVGAIFNRLTSDGDIALFRKDGTTVGSIGTNSNTFYIADQQTGLGFDYEGTDNILPVDGSGAGKDNAVDLGSATVRFDDIYATNGTIQTSDANEKQDIEALSDAEQRVAVAAKGLLRKYRWKSSVEEKGDDARIHFGIIAQDLKAAFEAEGLDAGRYAMFINTEWWEHSVDVPAVEADPENDIKAVEAYTRVDTYSTQEEAPEGAVKRSRMGIRYNQLLAFIIAAI